MRRRSSQVEPEGSVHQNWGLNCLPLTYPPQCSSPSRGWAPVSWPQLTQPDIGHSSPSWRDSLELIRVTCLPRGPCSPSPGPWGEQCQAPFRSSHNQGFGCSRGEDADHGDGVQEGGLLSSRSGAASPASLALEGGGDQPEGGPESRDGTPSQGPLGVPLPEPRPPGQLISFQTDHTLHSYACPEQGLLSSDMDPHLPPTMGMGHSRAGCSMRQQETLYSTLSPAHTSSITERKSLWNRTYPYFILKNASFVVVPNWKQPRFPSAVDG